MADSSGQIDLLFLNSLKKKLRGARRVVILGVGNKMKGDDGLGIHCAEILDEGFKKQKGIKVINGGEAPENYTGEIRKFKPSHVIIFDACSKNKKPGSIFLVDPNKIADEDVSTHRIPLSMLAKFLKETIGCKVIIIGIQPKSLEWRRGQSVPVRKSVTNLTALLTKNLPKLID